MREREVDDAIHKLIQHGRSGEGEHPRSIRTEEGARERVAELAEDFSLLQILHYVNHHTTRSVESGSIARCAAAHLERKGWTFANDHIRVIVVRRDRAGERTELAEDACINPYFIGDVAEG